MAKEMGVTYGSVQRNYVEKLMKMEERDKKKRQRDWEIGVCHEYYHIQCQRVRKGGSNGQQLGEWSTINTLTCYVSKRQKKEVIDKFMCQALWGDSEVSWEAQSASHSVSGILCLWSEKSFKLERKFIGSGFIMLVGKWLQEAQQIHIINIYSPCDIQNKRVLWDSVKQLKNQTQEGLWCIVGDFNNIRTPSERSGICQRGSGESNTSEFNDWIEELEVVEVPWVGKKFTWFRPNRAARNKLDRFLVSPEWLDKWPGSTQHTLDRNFSDHCPILLRSKFVD